MADGTREAAELEVLTLEEKLLGLGKDFRVEQAATVLTDDFREFGASGRVFTKAGILKELKNYVERRYSIGMVRFEWLGETTLLLTYRVSILPEARMSMRSSIWVLREERWQMLFHQGTRVPPKADV